MTGNRHRDGRVALTILTPEGHDWMLTMSPGMEVFIGRYRRLKGFECGSGLIRFSSVSMSGPPAASDKLL